MDHLVQDNFFKPEKKISTKLGVDLYGGVNIQTTTTDWPTKVSPNNWSAKLTVSEAVWIKISNFQI